MVPLKSLADTPFFDALEARERELLAQIAQRRSYEKGAVLFREGEEPGSLRVLVSGMVSFRQQERGDGGDVLMGTLDTPGAVFGIAALVGEEHVYPHSAFALEDSEVIEIDGEALLGLCKEKPVVGIHILLRLTQVLAERLSATREQIRSRIRPGLISHG